MHRLLYIFHGSSEDVVGVRGPILQSLTDSQFLADYSVFSLSDAQAEGGTSRGIGNELLRRARALTPTLIMWEHPGSFPVSVELLRGLRQAGSNAVLAYQEGDAYGLLRKRVPIGARVLGRYADVVYLCARGQMETLFRTLGASRIRYVPNHKSRAQFLRETRSDQRPDHLVTMVGNNIPPRRHRRSLPGAERRVRLASRLGQVFGKRFLLVGRGWDGFVGAVGHVPLSDVPDLLTRSRIAIGWNHFDRLPYYFSDRLPVYLFSGTPTISNRQPGLDELFVDRKEIWLAESVEEAVRLAQALVEMPQGMLNEIGRSGQDAASRMLASEVVWPRLFQDMLRIRHSK